MEKLPPRSRDDVCRVFRAAALAALRSRQPELGALTEFVAGVRTALLPETESAKNPEGLSFALWNMLRETIAEALATTFGAEAESSGILRKPGELPLPSPDSQVAQLTPQAREYLRNLRLRAEQELKLFQEGEGKSLEDRGK
jgi:hypothetical protein